VIQCQTFANQFCATRNARIYCISVWFDKCVPLWWAFRNSSAKSKKKEKNLKEPDPEPPLMIQIKDSIKFALIKADYSNRRLQYRKQMKEYQIDHDTRVLIGNGADELPRPRWTMLLETGDMIKLIERGFKVQLSEQVSHQDRRVSKMDRKMNKIH
jgi:hypothetical protein